MAEFENPTRRYKWFRPRQAARATNYAIGPNLATITLFNNSTGAHYLVIRAVRLTSFVGDWFVYDALEYGERVAGGFGALPLVPDMATLPGLCANVSSTNGVVGNQFAFDGLKDVDQYWEHDFPIAVVPPGWSYVLQNGTSAQDLQASLIWEAIVADELDYLY